MGQSISAYKSLKEISALTFNAIKFEGDVRLMDKAYDNSNVYNPKTIKALQDAWISLYDEYYVRVDDRKSKKDLQKKTKEFSLLFSIKQGDEFLVLLQYLKDNEEFVPIESYESALNTLVEGLKTLSKSFKWDLNKTTQENIDKNKSILEGLTTRYNRTKEPKKEEEKEIKTDISTFYDLKANIEMVLDKNNISEGINMLEWIAYEKQYKRKIEDANK